MGILCVVIAWVGCKAQGKFTTLHYFLQADTHRAIYLKVGVPFAEAISIRELNFSFLRTKIILKQKLGTKIALHCDKLLSRPDFRIASDSQNIQYGKYGGRVIDTNTTT